MRILKILNGNDGGGIFQCEKQFIKYWTKKNIEVDAIIVGDGKSKETYKNIVNEYYILPGIQLEHNLITPIKELKNLISVKRYYKKTGSKINQLTLKQYDAIIYRRHFFTELASYISNMINAEIYWHMPLSVSNFLERLYFRYLTNKHRINVIGNSQYSMQTIGDVSNHFVYPGYNNDRVAKTNTLPYYRKLLSIPNNEPIFGVAARIKKRKAQHIVIKSFIRLLSDFNDLHLVIAGSPLDSSYAKYCIKIASGYESNIHFIGHVDSMAEFYASIDVYINSRLDAEPFGISIAESLGSGLPVIAYKMGGPSEMVLPGYNGWLIEKPTVESYYKNFKQAIEDKNKWHEMGKNSTNFSDKFESKFNANKFINIIREKNIQHMISILK